MGETGEGVTETLGFTVFCVIILATFLHICNYSKIRNSVFQNCPLEVNVEVLQSVSISQGHQGTDHSAGNIKGGFQGHLILNVLRSLWKFWQEQPQPGQGQATWHEAGHFPSQFTPRRVLSFRNSLSAAVCPSHYVDKVSP